MNQEFLDALSLEYQRDYGTALSDLDISDFVNNPFVNCVGSVLSLGLPKESGYFSTGELGVFGDDTTNPFLIAQDSA